MPDDSARRSGIALTEKQRIAWLRLIRSDNVGPATFRQLINHCGSVENALAMLPELSRRGGATRSLRIASLQDAERELDAAYNYGASFVGIGEPDYPPALRHIDGAPPLVAIKGNRASATRPSVGIVGLRNASVVGAKFAAMIARRCGQNGYVITSGLARRRAGNTLPRPKISDCWMRLQMDQASPSARCRSAGNRWRGISPAATV